MTEPAKKTMRLEVEIKDGEFIYSYEIGGSSHTSTSPLGVDHLVDFVDLLRHCNNSSKHEHKEFTRNWDGRMWVRGNLVEAQDIINEMNKK
jgi:hypothetical protein